MIDKIDNYLYESTKPFKLLGDYRLKSNNIKIKYEESQRKLDESYYKKFTKMFNEMKSKDRGDLIQLKNQFFKERPFENRLIQYAKVVIKTLQGY